MNRDKTKPTISKRMARGLLKRTAAVAVVLLGLDPGAHADSIWQGLLGLFAPPPAISGSGNGGGSSEHWRGAPLPAGKGAPCEADLRLLYAKWLKRTVMAHYPADRDPRGAAYVQAVADHLSLNLNKPVSSEVLEQGRSFDLAGTNEPALLLMIGILDPYAARGREALRKALELFPASSYPKILWFMAAANIGQTVGNADGAETNERDALSLRYLEEALADDSFLPDEMPVLRWRFDIPSVQNLFERNSERVAQIFEASPKVDPWLKEYVRGQQFVTAAWAARGSGWASSVNAQGWHGFETNIAFARKHLVHAWNLNPHDPGAAAEMIVVCMAESEETEPMRLWFDRSVAADFDFWSAYKNLLWGLRPRWLGSAAEMTAFGDECAATGRYDTMVPSVRVDVAADITMDLDDGGAQFTKAENAEPVLAVLDRYFAEKDPPLGLEFYGTLGAIIAQKAGRAAEVQRFLAPLHYEPMRTSAFLNKMADVEALAREARAGATP